MTDVDNAPDLDNYIKKSIWMNTRLFQMLKKMGNKCNSINLFQKSIDTTRKSDKEESVDLSEIPPTEGDKEEVKEEKGLKILTPNKLLTRLPILLAQINSRINSKKFKNETRQILYLLYQHNKITK